MRVKIYAIMLLSQFLLQPILGDEESSAHQKESESTTSAETATPDSKTADASTTETNTENNQKPENAKSEAPKTEKQLKSDITDNMKDAENLTEKGSDALKDLTNWSKNDSSSPKLDGLSEVEKGSVVQGLFDFAIEKDTAWTKKMGEMELDVFGSKEKMASKDVLKGLERLANQDPKMEKRLVGMLGSADPKERKLAADVMAKMKNPPNDALAKRLSSETDPQVKSALLSAFQAGEKQVPSGRAIQELKAIAFEKSQDLNSRKEALGALQRLTPDSMGEGQENKSDGITLGGGYLVNNFHPTRAQLAPTLTKMIEDPSEPVEIKRAAFGLLKSQGDPRSFPALNHIIANAEKPAYQPMLGDALETVEGIFRRNTTDQTAGKYLNKIVPHLTDPASQERAVQLANKEGSDLAHMVHGSARKMIEQGLQHSDFNKTLFGTSLLGSGKQTSDDRAALKQVLHIASSEQGSFSPSERVQLINKGFMGIWKEGWKGADYQKVAEFLGKHVENPTVDRITTLRLVEGLRQGLSEKEGKMVEGGVVTPEQAAFDKTFSKQLNVSQPKVLNAQDALGKLIARIPDWNKADFAKETELVGGDSAAWKSATTGLNALFLSKSAKYNASAQSQLDQVVTQLLNTEVQSASKPSAPTQTKDDPTHSRLLASLQEAGVSAENMKTISTAMDKVSSKSLTSAEQLYSKQFYGLFLKDLAASYPLNDAQKELITSAIERNDQSLGRDFGQLKYRERDSKGTNSLFNTYALSTATLAADQIPSGATEALQSAKERSATPLSVPYYPYENTGAENPRSSAARNVPYYLSQYKLAKDAEAKTEVRETLIQSLENYAEKAPTLMAHVPRNDTHMGADALAPYYFYGTIPYATAALNVVANDKATTPAQRERVTQLRTQFQSIVANSISADLAIPQGSYQFPNSPIYVNPLLGLSILPLINEKEFGILNERDFR